MTTQINAGTVVEGSLKDASLDRLVCLRRLHQAFGEALRKEQLSREIDSLDP